MSIPTSSSSTATATALPQWLMLKNKSFLPSKYGFPCSLYLHLFSFLSFLSSLSFLSAKRLSSLSASVASIHPKAHCTLPRKCLIFSICSLRHSGRISLHLSTKSSPSSSILSQIKIFMMQIYKKSRDAIMTSLLMSKV